MLTNQQTNIFYRDSKFGNPRVISWQMPWEVPAFGSRLVFLRDICRFGTNAASQHNGRKMMRRKQADKQSKEA